MCELPIKTSFSGTVCHKELDFHLQHDINKVNWSHIKQNKKSEFCLAKQEKLFNLKIGLEGKVVSELKEGRQRCGGTPLITVGACADTHRTVVIHTDRVVIVAGGNGKRHRIGRGEGLSSILSPQWRRTLSGRGRFHQGPLCVCNHQVVNDGDAASRSQERVCGGKRAEGGKVQGRSILECSQRKGCERIKRKGTDSRCAAGGMRHHNSTGFDSPRKEQRKKLLRDGELSGFHFLSFQSSHNHF